MTVCSVAAIGLSSAGSAQAAVSYKAAAIVSASNTGKCLDADTNTLGHNGAKVQLWDCNRKFQQTWYIGSDGTISVRFDQTRWCLDADTNTAGNNGALVQLWLCNGTSQQKWTVTGGTTAALHNLINGRYAQSLDADTNTLNSNGGKVQMWWGNGQRNQYWQTLYF
jgi:hypothetical protein